jgi:nuclear transport factor 2 (NTF2) superfamily protein
MKTETETETENKKTNDNIDNTIFHQYDKLFIFYKKIEALTKENKLIWNFTYDVKDDTTKHYYLDDDDDWYFSNGLLYYKDYKELCPESLFQAIEKNVKDHTHALTDLNDSIIYRISKLI